jgi:hypothetical protein
MMHGRCAAGLLKLAVRVHFVLKHVVPFCYQSDRFPLTAPDALVPLWEAVVLTFCILSDRPVR